MVEIAGLRALTLFSHLDDRQIDQLASGIVRQRFSPGATILRHKESSSDLFLIERGAARLWCQTPLGDLEIATLEKDDLFGEVNFLDRQGHSGQVDARTECALLVLDGSALTALSERDTGFEMALYWTLWKSLSGKLRSANLQLARYFTPDAPRPQAPAREPGGSAPRVRLDLAAKRGVFEEQRLSPMEIGFLSSLSREQCLGPGETIFREGEAGDRMYIVVDGQVMISKSIPGRGEEALSFLVRGDYFGEMALIDKLPRSADARAHPDRGAVVLGLAADVVERILDAEKISSVRLLKILCVMAAKRLREINEKLLGWYVLSGGETSSPLGLSSPPSH